MESRYDQAHFTDGVDYRGHDGCDGMLLGGRAGKKTSTTICGYRANLAGYCATGIAGTARVQTLAATRNDNSPDLLPNASESGKNGCPTSGGASVGMAAQSAAPFLVF